MITKLIKEKTMAVRSELKSFDLASEDKDPLLLNARERIKLNQHAAISRQLIQVMNSYSKCQLEYREKCKARIRGKLTVAGSSFSEDQIEDMLEKKNPEIFTQSIMASTDAAKRSLLDIEARHADIIRLENSIAELHDLFMTVALMVDNQGDMIDQIEYNVNKAGNCAVQAKKKLSNAVGRKKKHRRCRLICAIILTVLVVLTIIAIASAIGLT
ncbi:unnamed protein product [Dicrocoelium dendriticum]|nr:unnamed protein product [Dicrocoelium dendriticum]